MSYYSGPTIAGLETFLERGDDVVGFKFKISFKKLGRNLKKLSKSPILRQALSVGSQVLGNPALGAALGLPPGSMQGLKAGMAALGIAKRAKAGDAKAKAVVARAMSGNATAADAVTADTDSVPVHACPLCGTVM